jgi:hypothetical protein
MKKTTAAGAAERGSIHKTPFNSGVVDRRMGGGEYPRNPATDDDGAPMARGLGIDGHPLVVDAGYSIT